MEINYVYVMSFDFCFKENEEVLRSKLNYLYKEAELVSDSEFNDSQYSTEVFYELETDNSFKYIATAVQKNIEDILDVITVGLIPKSEIDEIEKGENHIIKFENELNLVRNELNVFTKNIFDYPDDYINIPEPFLTYISIEKDINFFDNGGIIKENINEFMEKNINLLNRFNFNPLNLTSLFSLGNFITWDYLLGYEGDDMQASYFSILKLNERGFTEIPNDIVPYQVKYLISNFGILKDIFKSYYWLEYKNLKLQYFDKEMFKILSFDYNDVDWNKFDEYNNYQEKIKSKWIEFFAKTKDELEKASLFSNFLFDEKVELNYKVGEFDIPIEKNYGSQLTGGYNSVIYLLKRRLYSLNKKTIKDLERINKKQDLISDSFYKEINLRSVKMNKKYSRRMFWMTLIVVIATFISLFVDLNINIDEILNLIT